MKKRLQASPLAHGVLAINVFAYLLVGLALHQSHKQYEGQVTLATQNLARTLAINVSGVMDKIDIGLFAAANEVERQMASGGIDGKRLEQYLAGQQKQIRDFEGMWVADADGLIRWGTGITGHGPINIKDREYFQRLYANRASDLVISKPIIGRVTKAWSIMIGRRINHPDGSFRGVVLGSLRAEDYFLNLFSTIEPENGGVVVLRDQDMAVVTRYPKTTNGHSQIGSTLVSDTFRKSIKTNDRLTYKTMSAQDGVERIYSYQKVRNYPLYLIVGKGTHEALAPWNKEAVLMLALLGIFTTATILFMRVYKKLNIGKELIQQKVLLESIFNGIPDAIILVGTDGRFITVNHAFFSIFEYTQNELKKGNASIIFEDVSKNGAASFNLSSAVSMLPTEVNFRKKTGEVFPGEIVGSAIKSASGTPLGFIGVIRNISERKQAEEERAELHSQLSQSQKMESLGILSGGIAHDMNNVLAAILSLASAHLFLESRESQVYPALEIIRDAAVRGGDLVKSLLHFARKEPSTRKRLDLNVLLLEDARLLERTTLSKVRLELDLAPDLHVIHGDASALTHAFMNLCVNAVDAMEDGGTLTLLTRNVDEDTVELLIQDTGCGMTEEVVSQALVPFFSTKEVGKGTGLGLSMVYKTVAAHQGQLSIQSEPGSGTTIRMRFPVTVTEDLGPEADLQSQPEPSAQPLAVLLVDDDDLILKSTRMLVEILGHTVTPTSSGEEALALLEQGYQPEVVILDMNMPGIGGKGTLPRLRAMLPKVPILLATGRADQDALDLIAAHPRVTLLSKPFTIEELREHLAAPGQG